MRAALVPGSVLVCVDVQRDFCPGGALPVPRGDEVAPVLDAYARRFDAAGLQVVATRDWHPPAHVSFAERGGPWPAHCVQGTPGAELHAGLHLPPGALVVSKGDDPDRDAYSGFQGTDLEARLRRLGARRVLVGGLATDYCVRATVLDALDAGFEAWLLQDATRGVEARAGDSARAVEEMMRRGAVGVRLAELLP